MFIEHDEWAYSPLKSEPQPALKIGEIYGVLPFKGVRNPLFMSSSSQKAVLAYCVPADGMRPRLHYLESLAELAVAHEALLDPRTFDLECQPCTVPYEFEGQTWDHTYDLRLTMVSGERRLIFVRYRESLFRSIVQAELKAILKATPATEADRVLVVDADDYSRARRDNLRRMHLVARSIDPEADERVLDAARQWGRPCFVSELASATGLVGHRVFQSALRLIGRRVFVANLDAAIGQYSKIWLPEAA
jgi:hypothetical protein